MNGFPKHRAQDADAVSQDAGRNAVIIVAGALIVVLLVVFFAMAGLAWQESQLAAFQQQGGTIEEKSDERNTVFDKTERLKPFWEAPDVGQLLGMDRAEALAAIGHGAAVKEEASVDLVDGDATMLTVALASERSKDQPGAPLVYLQLDDRGKVTRASYSASMRGFGFTNKLTFREAIEDMHVVELALADVGVTVPVGTVHLPEDEAAYSTYRDDGRTLEREHADFKGSGTYGGAPVRWTASLDFDYAEAIQTGNLVYTHRVLTVGVVLS